MLSIYFNRTYATATHVFDLLRDNPDRRQVRILASHVDPDSPVLARADLAFAEPDLTGEHYIEWALDFTARHGVDIFVPRVEQAVIAAARDRFAAAGVAVLAPSAQAIAHFEDKAATYHDAQARGVPVPPFHVVRTGQSLIEAYGRLRTAADRVIMKPVSGVGAAGFRVLTDEPLLLGDVIGPLEPLVGLGPVVNALDRAHEAGTSVPPLLLMPLLPGPEVSVDALSDDGGRTVGSVARSKDGRRRMIVEDERATAIATTLIGAHRLSTLSNTQVRYWQAPGDTEPRPYLLEVNTRISGGLFQTKLAGVNLAWSAVRMALGLEPQLGVPNTGIGYTTGSSVLSSGTVSAEKALRSEHPVP
ncbi:ATP-grasp domain-containing protein [Jatrophihabitans telluris]|uniref:ATP-grasp domain-containing protein n=1 Tax=Jatrophihabitans telluris TaxID=2038343 RepID=A0ABY4R2W0_9ACTN|nr:ATP-grasp domain-containing protein [Jatrophihabitans telluris]UQX90251.1 ATP-grasp domain-containing protein [Jatrophihabitans telluris]